MASPNAPTVLLCRDCCCGSVEKHPETDHAGQERALVEAAEAAGGRVVPTKCLGQCGRSNVIGVRQRQGSDRRTLWLGDVLQGEQTAALAGWVQAGAFRAGPLPRLLLDLQFTHHGVVAPMEGHESGFEP